MSEPDRLRVEDELRNYKLAINHHSIVAITDRLGRITYVNDRFCQLSQYTQEELIGQDHRIINSGHHPKEFFQDLYKTIHAGEIWNGEIKNKAKDGTYYWVLTTITPVKNDEGVITKFISVRTDITENKDIEQKLITQNQQLLEMQQALQASIEESKELSISNELFKQKEEELKISNTRFQLAAAQAKIGIWDRDLINDQSYWDDRLFQLYGLKDKSIDINDGKIWRNLIHPDDLEKVQHAIDKAIDGSDVFNIDYRVVWEDGSIHHLKPNAIIQRDSSGRPIRMMGTVMDVTEQKLIEIDLIKSKEQYKRDNLLLEESQAIAKLGGWQLDLISGQLYWSAETYRIHDTSPEEFNPTVDAGVGYFLPESKRIISEALEVAMATGQGYDLSLQTYTTKGRLIDVRTTCAVTMKDGKPVKLTGIFQDITEQKKIQNEIETYNTRLSLATSAANIGIWEYIIEDEKLIWDDNMLSLYGLPKNKFSGTYDTWRSLVHPKDIKRSEQELENAIAGIKDFDTEFRIVWADKSIHYIRAFANVIHDERGNPIKVSGANYDITENVRKEIELVKAKEKAEENDRLKSAFLANMRHEIRNPMNGIVGFSKQMAAPDLTEEQRAEFSSIVINSSNQLLSIIDDITAFSLLETNQVHVNKSDVNINDLLTELEMQFGIQAKTRDLQFKLIKSLPREQSFIATDKSKLARILTNLLTNALKFTHTGAIEFGYEIKDQELLFFVRDSGIGVNSDHLEKIFNSFHQADKSISRKYGGTGLGLAISMGLTEILGGKIWVESTINEGSIFYVSLPFDQVNYSINPSKIASSNEINTNILIAEDQSINFYYLKVVLERNFNCNIFHALNGEEAVEIFKKNPGISLILMDINMPVMDGFDAAKIIKAQQPEVPIIAQTGYDIVSNEKYSSEIFNTYISKPIDEDSLLAKVALHISKVS